MGTSPDRESGVGAAGEHQVAASNSETSLEDGALEDYLRGSGVAVVGSGGTDGLEDSEEVDAIVGHCTEGGGGGGGSNPAAGDGGTSSSSASSSIFDFSLADSATVSDVWRGGGGAGVGLAGNPVGGAGVAGLMTTPERDALRLEILTATVAATVAEVAAETYTSSAREGFRASSSSTSSSGSTSSVGVENVASLCLPMAGSRSPSPVNPAPGRRERELADEHVSDSKSPGTTTLRRRSTGGTSSDGLLVGLPLAGSRSPPRAQLPGRRSPDSDDDFAGVLLAPPAVSTARASSSPPLPAKKSTRRGRRQRRRGEGGGQGVVTVVTSAAAAAPGESSASAMSSAPLDLRSSRASVLPSADGSGGGEEGRQQRDAEYRAEERLLRSGKRSENSWWDKESSSGDGECGVADGGGADHEDGLGSEERRALLRPRETVLGTTRRDAHRSRPSMPAAAVVAARPRPSRPVGSKTKPKQPEVGWHNVTGRNCKATAAAAAAVVAESVSGLRATHFAPGYVGVAWPGTLEAGGAAAQDLSVARARILTRLEEASSRKLADVEERALRARRERAERVKRRWVLLRRRRLAKSGLCRGSVVV